MYLCVFWTSYVYLLQVSYVYKVAAFIIVCVEIYSEYKKCNREGVNLGKCTQLPAFVYL